MQLKILACLMLFTSTNSYSNDNSDTVLNVCWEKSLKPPYLLLNDKDKLHGIAVDWLKRISIDQSLAMNHVIYPWKRCLLELERGRIDLVPNASYKSDRAEIALYTNPIYATHLNFYFLKSNVNINGKFYQIEDFKAYSVGGVSGFNYSFLKDIISVDTGANNRSALLSKLLKGRIDFAIIQAEIFNSLLSPNHPSVSSVGHVPSPVNYTKQYHILVSKHLTNGPAVVSKINKGLDLLIKTGEYQRIIDQYLAK